VIKASFFMDMSMPHQQRILHRNDQEPSLSACHELRGAATAAGGLPTEPGAQRRSIATFAAQTFHLNIWNKQIPENIPYR
jgi:hypothetical protein